MARKPAEAAAGPIRFTAAFDDITVAQTVRYAPGDVVNNPSAALREAAEGRFESAPEAEEQPVGDGQ